jgi:hypothetical protein
MRCPSAKQMIFFDVVEVRMFQSIFFYSSFFSVVLFYG